jgi:hypothetical protein
VFVTSSGVGLLVNISISTTDETKRGREVYADATSTVAVGGWSQELAAQLFVDTGGMDPGLSVLLHIHV